MQPFHSNCSPHFSGKNDQKDHKNISNCNNITCNVREKLRKKPIYMDLYWYFYSWVVHRFLWGKKDDVLISETSWFYSWQSTLSLQLKFLFSMIIIVLVGIVKYFLHHFYCNHFIANAFTINTQNLFDYFRKFHFSCFDKENGFLIKWFRFCV